MKKAAKEIEIDWERERKREIGTECKQRKTAKHGTSIENPIRSQFTI